MKILRYLLLFFLVLTLTSQGTYSVNSIKEPQVGVRVTYQAPPNTNASLINLGPGYIWSVIARDFVTKKQLGKWIVIPPIRVSRSYLSVRFPSTTMIIEWDCNWLYKRDKFYTLNADLPESVKAYISTYLKHY